MNQFITVDSQERGLCLIFTLLWSILIVVSGSLLWLLTQKILYLITWLFVSIPIGYWVHSVLNRLMFNPYRLIQVQLDAVKMSDPSIQVDFPFSSGVAGQLYDDVFALAQHWKSWQQLEKQHVLLVNELLQAFASPIIVINSSDQLIMGNQAFSIWLDKDWRLVRLTDIKRLGFTKQQQWQLVSGKENEELHTSEIKIHGETHTLLLITNIASALARKQQQSWRQMVRVLSHEIKNSLTPIKSIAQTLTTVSKDPAHKEMLNVIVERSHGLQQFVDNYASIDKPIRLDLKRFTMHDITKRLQQLYPALNVENKGQPLTLIADEVLLEQVLMNAIKNAFEACHELNAQQSSSTNVSLYSWQDAQCVYLMVSDNGVGISNPDNLFVPFYTTKPNGQGIGLAWSKRVIEQHGGSVSLQRNQDQTQLTIRLPNLQQ